MNDTGDAAAAWLQTNPAAGVTGVMVAVHPAGAAWSTPRQLGVASAAALSAAALAVGLDGGGAATLAWLAGDGVVLTASRPAGGDWGAPEPLAGAASGVAALRLGVGRRGDAVASWVSDCRALASRRPAGGSWEAPLPLDADGSCGDDPAVVVDGAGDAIAAWRRWTGTSRVLRIAERPAAAATWGAVRDLGSAAPTAGPFRNPPRLLAGADGGAAAVWRDAGGEAEVAVRSPGGRWSAPERVPGFSASVADLAAAASRDGSVAAFQTSLAGVARAAIREADGSWMPAVPLTVPAQGSAPGGAPVIPAASVLAMDGADDAVLASYDPLLRVGHVSDLTRRAGPPPAPALPRVTHLSGPATVPAGAVARLVASLERPAEGLEVAVERRVGSRWSVVGRHRLSATFSVEVPVRLGSPGRAELRLRMTGADGATRATAPVAVQVTRPERVRLAAGPSPSGLAVGLGALWVLGQDDGEATLRRLSPASGRQVGRTIAVGGSARAIAAGAGAVWVVRGANGYNGTDALVRVSPSGTVGSPQALEGQGASVAASRDVVWLAGVCLPQRLPPAPASSCDQRGATKLDAATGELTSVRAASRGGHVDAVSIFGTTLWAWGEQAGNYDNTVLSRADARTGAVATSRLFPGGSAFHSCR